MKEIGVTKMAPHARVKPSLAKASWYVCEGLPRGIIEILLVFGVRNGIQTIGTKTFHTNEVKKIIRSEFHEPLVD